MSEFNLLEENSSPREDLSKNITETYGLINMILSTLGFFTKIFSETIVNVADLMDKSISSAIEGDEKSGPIE